MNPIAKIRGYLENLGVAKTTSQVPVNINEAGGSLNISPQNVKNFVVKAVGNIDTSGNNDFAPPESDLGEIRDAIGADSYVKLAVSKYSQLIFKAGYHIVSDNDAAAEYIQQRFNLMSFTTRTPMDILLQGIADDLVAYSNAFLLISRDDKVKVSSVQAKGALSQKPVAGYFRVDPTTIQIKRDKNGTIKNYQQQVGNDKKAYKPEDVIHFYIDKKGGAAFGTPRIEAALEDVKILRKLEGLALKLGYRYAAPLYQMKVGIPQAGMMATNQEIKDAQKEVERLADDGILITNERTEFNIIGADGHAIDLVPYLKYHEARVFSALSLSPAQCGRGGAKQDADSMEEQTHDAVKFYQRTISTFMENFVILELLLEGGYDPITNVQDQVHFKFEEINLDTKVKMETHALNILQGNGITYDEYRTRMGLRSDTVDESRLYQNMIVTPAELALTQAKAATTGASGNGNSGPAKSAKPNGSASNTMAPKNQHGTSSAHIKENAQIDLRENTVKERQKITDANIEDYRKKFGAVYKKYNSVRNELCEDGAKNDYIVLPLIRDDLADSLKRYVKKEALTGYAQAIKDVGEIPETQPNIGSSVIESRIDKHLNDMFKDIQTKLKGAKNKEEKEAAFNSSEYRLRFLADQVAAKAQWYAYVKTCAALGIKQVYVDFNSSDDKKEYNRVIHTKNFSLDDIPAFHPYCRCTLGTKRQVK